MFFPQKNYKKGFTLVELLVTISIFVILTGVVLFSQSKFDSSILLTNLAYDTALTIRQAQTYAVNVREFFDPNQNDTVFNPYGVYFNLNSNKSFILYTDLDNGKLYNSNRDINLSQCTDNNGCLNKYNLKRGNFISGLCVLTVDKTEPDCDNISSLDIVFERPNTDAIISINDNNSGRDSIVGAVITLSGVDGSTRRVKVQSNGLIEVLNN